MNGTPPELVLDPVPITELGSPVDFILWDPNCRYTQAAALERVPRE